MTRRAGVAGRDEKHRQRVPSTQDIAGGCRKETGEREIFARSTTVGGRFPIENDRRWSSRAGRARADATGEVVDVRALRKLLTPTRTGDRGATLVEYVLIARRSRRRGHLRHSLHGVCGLVGAGQSVGVHRCPPGSGRLHRGFQGGDLDHHRRFGWQRRRGLDHDDGARDHDDIHDHDDDAPRRVHDHDEPGRRPPPPPLPPTAGPEPGTPSPGRTRAGHGGRATVTVRIRDSRGRNVENADVVIRWRTASGEGHAQL